VIKRLRGRGGGGDITTDRNGRVEGVKTTKEKKKKKRPKKRRAKRKKQTQAAGRGYENLKKRGDSKRLVGRQKAP